MCAHRNCCPGGMSMLMLVPTTVKLWRLKPSFLTTSGRRPWMEGGSLGWMSWKWSSTATTTYRPEVDGGVVITTMGRGENAGVGRATAGPEQAVVDAARVMPATVATAMAAWR